MDHLYAERRELQDLVRGPADLQAEVCACQGPGTPRNLRLVNRPGGREDLGQLEII